MGLKNLWAEFKAFAFKGNMIELAVAVVIGAAFSTVINSLVNDVIMPSVGYVVNHATAAAEKVSSVAANTVTGKTVTATQPTTTPADAAATATGATPTTTPPAEIPPAKPDDAKPAPVKINLMIGPVNAGAFIGSLINFLLVAAAVFLVIVKLLGSVMKKVSKAPAPSEPTTKECPRCLSLIPIKATKCSQCTADLPELA